MTEAQLVVGCVSGEIDRVGDPGGGRRIAGEATISADLEVATTDPVTGQAITYRNGRDGAITGASHPASVLSFLALTRPGTTT